MINRDEEEKYLKIAFNVKKDGEEAIEYTLKERYDSIVFLLGGVNDKLNKLQEIKERYQMIKDSLQKEAIDAFKKKQIKEFVNTYYSTKEKITPDMIKKWEKIEKTKKYACYHINGVDVEEKDCKICHKRCELHSEVNTEDGDEWTQR